MTAVPEVDWPDAELLVLNFLRDAMTGTRCVTELPANLEKQLPLVQVTRIGGSSDGFRLDRARLDVDCYAATRLDAAILGRQVRTLLPTLRNQEIGGAVVVAVTEEVGPSWRPDYNPGVSRRGATYALTLRPA